MDSLNPAQRRAVEHHAGPQIVLAGPGSGKTRVITHRVAHLITARAVPPEQIVAVTYTVKAAEQLRAKLTDLVGARGAAVNAHTFHGLGLRILRRFADEADLPRARLAGAAGALNIIDSSQRRRLLRQIIREHTLFPHARARAVEAIIEEVEHAIDFAADMGMSPADIRALTLRARDAASRGRTLDDQPLDQQGVIAELQKIDRLAECARAAELYAQACHDRAWLSFADLISAPAALLTSRKRVRDILHSEWRHFVVDEFQDVNSAQIEMLRALAPPAQHPDVTVVGDDDQSIYEFRGADERAFARFAQLWSGARIEHLSINYRSGPPIVALASSIISRAARRFAPDKVLEHSSHAPGREVELIDLTHDFDDADAIAAMILTDRHQRPAAGWKDYAIVARTRSDLSRIAGALELEGVPSLSQEAASALDDDGVQRALGVVESLVDPMQSHAIVRLLLRPPLSLPLETVQRLSRDHRERVRADQNAGLPPTSMLDWLRAIDDPPSQIRRLLEWFDDLAKFDAEHPADQTIHRIISTIDAVHADVPSAHDRARRVSALLALIRFAADRQSKLEEPGDLRAFWSYYQDLSPRDQRIENQSAETRIDEDSSEDPDQDAVRLLTAHSAKGLEFDTVFVPRVAPSHGYPSTKSDDRENDWPAGLVDRDGDPRSAKERRLDEERRIFYVACTRAQRRLVLLAKKNKTKSKSTHFYEELKFDPSVKSHIVVRDLAEIYRAAADADVGGPSAAWRSSLADAAERRLVPGGATIDQIVDRARRQARIIAAAALDSAEALAESGDSPAPPVQQSLAAGDAAACLAIAAHLRRARVVPAWATDPATTPSPRVRAFAEQLAAEVSGTLAALSDDAPGAAFAALARQLTPKPPLTLSYSQLHTYLTCPRCYFARFILGLPERFAGRERLGSIVHSVLQRYFQRLRDADADGSPPPSQDDLVRSAHETYDLNIPRAQRDDLQRAQIVAQVLRARDMHDPQANILELEKPVILPFTLANYTHEISVRLDRIDESADAQGSRRITIIDYKTGEATKRKLSPPADDLQLCLYALAARDFYNDPALDGAAEYWVLSTAQRGSLSFADMKLDKVRSTIESAIQNILDGKFERSKSDFFAEHACDAVDSLRL